MRPETRVSSLRWPAAMRTIREARSIDRQDLVRLGARFAPLFHAFVRAAAHRARERGFDRICYLTREGEFFQEIHARIAATARGPLPAPVLLEVSRRSTFAASLDAPTPQALMRVWTLYSRQTPRALLLSLNVDADLYEAALRRCGLALDEPVDRPWEDRRVQVFLADGWVAERLGASCAHQRRLLREYCAVRGIDDRTSRVALVDVGWRGTIQDNLAHVFPGVEFDGFYLGLQRFLNPQRSNVAKTAFGPNENVLDTTPMGLLTIVTPLEMLANSASGTVTGYEETPAGVRARRDHHRGEDDVYWRYTRAFQHGVLDSIEQLETASYATTHADARARAMGLWWRLAFNPPRALARAYLDLVHDETFGIGGPVPKRAPSPVTLAVPALVSGTWRQRLERHLDASTWPAAVATAYRVRWLTLLALRRRSFAPPAGRFDRLLASGPSRRRWRRVVRELEGARVCGYGAGEFAAAVLRHRDLSRLNVVGFVDRDPLKTGTRLGGYPVCGPASLPALNPDVILMTMFRNPEVARSVEALVRQQGLTCPIRTDIWE